MRKNGMIRLCSVVTLLCAMTAITQSSMTFANEDGAETRVMSFNIRYGSAKDGENAWEHRKEFVVETIQKFQPDLLGLQEAEHFQKDFIAANTSGYGVEGVGRNDGKLAGEMTAVFYKLDRFEKLEHGHFWLSETPDVVGSKGWDTSLPRIATWVKLKDLKDENGRIVYFLNTHYDHVGKVARAESSTLILKKIAAFGPDASVIVTGDFNAEPGSQPYQRLFSAEDSSLPALQDVYRVKHPEGSGNESTFNGFKFEREGGNRIDWVAATKDWHVVDATINRVSKDKKYPSDHFPIEVILKQAVK